MTMSELQRIVDNADELIERAKRLKSSKQRHAKILAREQDAREEVQRLNEESLQIAKARAEGADMSALREMAVVERELRRAHNRIDDAIDKEHEGQAEVEESARQVMALLTGETGETSASDDLSEEGIVVTTHHEDVAEERQLAEAG